MATAATEYRLSGAETLKRFVQSVLAQLDVDPADAAIVADVLVAADVRGIESHGVACLEPYYVSRLRQGHIAARPKVEIIRETGTSLVVDAGNGLGPVVAQRTMEHIIAKAREHGAAFGAVRNSNHFGIAGYYAMLGLEHDLVGIASTNAVRSTAPTYGRDLMLGGNPFAYAVPTGSEPAFVLDFATTAPTTFSPLGGLGVDSGGHKGYGLGLLADIFCGVLSGGTFGAAMPLVSDDPVPGAISHWFAAFRVDGFCDSADFKRDMDLELRGFKDSARAPGQQRIYVAGEIEHEKTLAHLATGVPVHIDVWDGLEQLAGELGLAFEIERA